ncbi:MAG TPA: histidinol-phosphatase [Paracoccaceae bacterium]|nr:histidinol-phosphatase [Paracoccaceae bacterium]
MQPAGMDDTELDQLFVLAQELADAAGAAALPYFRRHGLASDDKGAESGACFDPVTVADRAAERAIRDLLAEKRPRDGIFGEEEAHVETRSGLTWVIDPIDGTRSFISGVPLWGILIALDDGARGRIGIFDQPYTRERFTAILRGSGAEGWLDSPAGRQKLQTRPCAGLAEATLFTTDPLLFTGSERDAFETIRARARLTRYSADGYAYALLAAGHVDLVVESGLEAFDVAAHVPLITAAGGVITGWQGEDCRWGGRVVAAGSPELHAEALKILSQVPG